MGRGLTRAAVYVANNDDPLVLRLLRCQYCVSHPGRRVACQRSRPWAGKGEMQRQQRCGRALAGPALQAELNADLEAVIEW